MSRTIDIPLTVLAPAVWGHVPEKTKLEAGDNDV